MKCLVDSIVFPKRWEEAGFAKPNDIAKKTAKRICSLCYNLYSVFPNRVAASKEGGIMLVYKVPYAHTTIFEVYNDSGYAVVYNDDIAKEIISLEEGKC